MKKEICKQFINSIPVGLLAMNTGIAFLWPAPTFFQFQKDGFPLTREETSWIGSMSFFGKIMGSCLTCLLMDSVGRKKSLILCSIGFTIHWAILTCFKTVPAILIGRFICGIFQSIFMLVGITYCAENSYPSIRGKIMAFKYFCLTIGYIFVNVLVLYMNYHFVHFIFFIMSIMITISLMFINESTEFLLSKNRYDHAKKSFFSIRSTENETDINYFQELIRHSERSTNIFTPVHKFFTSNTPMKGLKILIIMNCLGNIGVGMAPFHSYSTLFFSKDVDTDFVSAVTIIQQIIAGFGGLVGTIVMEKFQRKSTCTAGFSVFLITMILLAILFKWNYSMYPIEHFNYYVFILLNVIEFMCGAFFAPFNDSIIGEILPQNIKATGLAILVMTYSIGSGISNYAFWYVEKWGGIALNFVIYSIVLVFVIIYAHFNLPETRNKTLIQIENELSGKVVDKEEEIVEKITTDFYE